jgi:fucose permease
MVVAQGTLGYSVASVMGPIPAEIFQGRHFGSIFGTIMVAAILGGAAGPWLTGVIYDATGTYAAAWWIAIGFGLISILAIWIASPGKVRAVAGRAERLAAGREVSR